MKVRIPTKARLSNTQKEAIEQFAKEQVEATRTEQIGFCIDLMAYVLNRRYGFGKQRICTVAEEIANLANEHYEDEEFHEHLHRALVDIGLYDR